MGKELNEKFMDALENSMMKIDEGNSYSFVSMASGIVVNIFQTPKTISRLVVNSASTPLTGYDNASGASGSIVFNLDSAAAPYGILVGAKLLQGLTVTGAAVASSSITVMYR